MCLSKIKWNRETTIVPWGWANIVLIVSIKLQKSLRKRLQAPSASPKHARRTRAQQGCGVTVVEDAPLHGLHELHPQDPLQKQLILYKVIHFLVNLAEKTVRKNCNEISAFQWTQNEKQKKTRNEWYKRNFRKMNHYTSIYNKIFSEKF